MVFSTCSQGHFGFREMAFESMHPFISQGLFNQQVKGKGQWHQPGDKGSRWTHGSRENEGQSCRDRKELSAARGAGGEHGSDCFIGTGVPFGVMDMPWN